MLKVKSLPNLKFTDDHVRSDLLNIFVTKTSLSLSPNYWRVSSSPTKRMFMWGRWWFYVRWWRWVYLGKVLLRSSLMKTWLPFWTALMSVLCPVSYLLQFFFFFTERQQAVIKRLDKNKNMTNNRYEADFIKWFHVSTNKTKASCSLKQTNLSNKAFIKESQGVFTQGTSCALLVWSEPGLDLVQFAFTLTFFYYNL